MRNVTDIDISVIIPIFNGEKWINRCIMSIESQLFKGIEIICINDGSTDGSYQELKKLKEKYDNIKIIQKQNQGVSAARNDGIKIAKGRWIAFLDVDDVWMQGVLSQEDVSKWKKENYGIIAWQDCRANEQIDRFRMKEKREEKVVRGKSSTIWCVGNCMGALFYSRNIIEKYHVHFYEELKYGEDTIFRLMNIYLNDKIYISNTCLYVYVENKNSAMHTLKIDSVPYYSSIINGYLRMQNDLNTLSIEEKGVVEFGTAASRIYWLDMAITQSENLKSLKPVLKFREDNLNIYKEKCSNLSQERQKEINLLEEHRKIFACKYLFKGIIKQIIIIVLAVPGIYKIRSYKKYNLSMSYDNVKNGDKKW